MKEIHFIRHADSRKGMLTENGMAETQITRRQFEENGVRPLEMKAHTPSASRMEGTAALIIHPDTGALEKSIRLMKLSGVMQNDEDLDYTIFTEDEQDIELLYDETAKKGVLMSSFYLDTSDTYLQRNKELRTFTTMSQTLARKSIEITQNHPSYNHHLVVTREFFWPNFRAAMLQKRVSKKAAQEYAEWYSQTQENHDQARFAINTIRHDNDDWVLNDQYGEAEFSLNDLRTLGGLDHE